ncbi:hypothetical protein ABB37_00939 [Leptomonas pyrrhocoris]|uniref:Uncharacterized protein n=1 Tax=Leptomonas pyrrhocoris TaxID=157538 RepID=A0A0N0VHY8_LEPPY|nr:hypothetical protein ABB37_00939 [Leptomonas pyrrhocoris]XP_015665340.1 hypothetical protein ABB37_00939 [Leptomonas pyrrhocoris]KPA86900.1 hypothetical protein ABB37_00939 [Leptomonas pyrrhocoris]KPA86901.1 hypothetical protein ABB37_00939 [Leptomonas pyrrhocoris]|eukprot:XP_015665339.1 hypothetical protein ABB37_00939 [Leptomonas pyrrhocoris]
MLVHVAKTVVTSGLRSRRLHAVTCRSLPFLVERCVVQRRGRCTTTTRPSRCSSPAHTNRPFTPENEEKKFSTKMLAAAAASSAETSTSADIVDQTAPQCEKVLRDCTDNGEEYNADTPGVVDLVKQLQQLAARRGHHSSSRDGCTTSEGSADALVDLMMTDESVIDHVLPHRTAPESTVSGSEQPAWEAGLQLAERSLWSAKVAEWLLFLCLRSQDAASAAPAPLEVCEGVYRAWRQRRNTTAAAASAEMEHSIVQGTEDVNEEDKHADAAVSLRSPFEPKGVHHHYAAWLLKEFHSTQRFAEQVRAAHGDSAYREADVCADGGGGARQRKPADASPREFSEAEAVHHAHVLINRALEVLLLELPQDAAVAFPLAGAASSGRHRRQRTLSALRPTTALLVLEASRQLAQLAAHHHQHQHRHPLRNYTAAFPLLAFLTTSPPSSVAAPPDVKVCNALAKATPLADVARAAFELVIRTAPPPRGMSTMGVSAPHAVQSDAVMLYLGFLMASASSQRRTTDGINRVVREGSATARQLSRHSGDHSVFETEPRNRSALLPVEDRVTETVAAAVRTLLSSYLSDNAPSTPKTPTAWAAERSSTRQAVMKAFAGLLPQPTPANLWSVFTLPSNEDASLEQRYTSPNFTQRQKHTRPVSWCAWLLRVLLCDLERSGQASTGQQRNTPHSSNSSITVSITEADSTEVWKRRSDWIMFMTTQMMMQLRQQYISAPLQSPHRLTRSTAVAVHRPLQEVWHLIFQAALQGYFLYVPCAESAASVPSLQAFRSPQRPQRRPYHSPGATAHDAPPILLQLCYPYYDKTQWRGPSVNLYVRLLDQWGQGEHIRQVFAAVARRESDSQAEVQAAVAAEQRRESGQAPQSASIEHNEAAANRIDRAFRRYRPALHLHTCLTTLKYCGCSVKALSALNSVDGGRAGRRSHDEELNEENVNASCHRSGSQAAADARLAGEVVRYILCSLHVMERNAKHTALRHNPVDPTVDGEDETDAGATTMLITEGYPLAQWVKWVGDWCVPAVEQLYRNAGLEDEWAALGY